MEHFIITLLIFNPDPNVQVDINWGVPTFLVLSCLLQKKGSLFIAQL